MKTSHHILDKHVWENVFDSTEVDLGDVHVSWVEHHEDEGESNHNRAVKAVGVALHFVIWGAEQIQVVNQSNYFCVMITPSFEKRSQTVNYTIW